MNTRLFYLIAIICFSLLSPASGQESDRVRTEIEDLLSMQSEAWNKGDIEGFMQTYWDQDELQFLSKSGPTFGYQNTLQNYYKRYPDRQSMGQLTFNVISLNKRSRKVYSLIGRYHLERVGIDNLEGYFLLILQKIRGHWKIVADSTH
ncbi:MAG: DUF4440 domain-containing protein [Saprospiraceae bacterium]|nr:DUF4440 domain-containing protein [Saprospiraceae bacterium]